MSRQFDVCRVSGLRGESAVDLAIVLQDDTLVDLSTRIVAPLVPVGARYSVARAAPVIESDRVHYVVAMHLITTVPRRNLGPPIANLRQHETVLKNAIDIVFFGV